jgi:uncharacterized protein YbbC (DUF1343 family)
MISLFLGCEETETTEDVQVDNQQELIEEKTKELESTEIETTEEYSKISDQFEKSIKVLNDDEVKVEIFETIEEPVYSDINEPKKTELLK